MRKALTVLVRVSGVALLAVACSTAVAAQQQSLAPRKPLGPAPVIFDSTSRGPNGAQIPGPRFGVVPIKGLQRPYAMAFLPDRRILVTERAGRIRLISGNAVDPRPVSGVPPVLNRKLRGMNDIALHPKFAENGRARRGRHGRV